MNSVSSGSMFYTCKKCREFLYKKHYDRHNCLRYEAATDYSKEEIDDGYGEWEEVYTTGDPEQAAEKYAKETDQDGDYPFADGAYDTVYIKDAAGQVHKFHIDTEMEINYSATIQEPE